MSKITILIADNDRDVLHSLGALLETVGYHVVIAVTPDQAKEILNQGNIDLAILDVRLEDDTNIDDSSGLDVAKETSSLIPKIIMTAFMSASFVKDAFSTTETGFPAAINYISKMGAPESLLTAVEQIVEERIKPAREKEVEQFKVVDKFWDKQLEPLRLDFFQLSKQNNKELEQSLERLNDAVRFPDAFGTLKLKISSDGSLIITSESDFHYEVGILPALLERKGLILERLNTFKDHAPKNYNDANVADKDFSSNDDISDQRTIKILFLSSNPKGTSQLRLDEEIREIDRGLLLSEFHTLFDIKQHWAVRVFDLQGYLLRHKPDIVHFSGHGNQSSEIILEDNLGNSHPVSARALSRLFSVLKDNIRCVVLNACYSENQAQAIAENIDCVIGMSRSISDMAAISFASSFYQAIGFGRNVKTAFDLGCIQIDLENLDEQSTPKLLALNCNPQDLIFVK